MDGVAKSASKMWGRRWGGGERVKLWVDSASSFSSQIARLLSAAMAQATVWQWQWPHWTDCDVTLAVKLPPFFLQNLQTTKWSYFKNNIKKQAPFLIKSVGIFYFLQPGIFTDNTQLGHLTGSHLWTQSLSVLQSLLHSTMSECLKM